jgi:hypothetical protein
MDSIWTPFGVHGFAWIMCSPSKFIVDLRQFYAVKIVLKKPHFEQKLIQSIHLGSAESPPRMVFIWSPSKVMEPPEKNGNR